MKQIVQYLDSGKTELLDVPAPAVRDGHLLIQSTCSAVSLGTERMLVSFGKANWVQKALQQPEKVRQVFDKVKTDGLMPTIESVRSKLNTPIPLGYSNVGRVLAVGNGVHGFSVGDRVASNGAHAELVLVSQNLVAKVPDEVSDESAAFTTIASIALQGIRLLSPSFGETVVVYGLGILGQIAAQLLRAQGCTVLGVDAKEDHCAQLREDGFWAVCNHGEEQMANTVVHQNKLQEVDAVLICAAAQGDHIISDAAKMCRKRGRIVLVGVVDLQLNRSDFYEKELTFQVSASYGPGRYDYDYEQNTLDYPAAFVRWTAQRNFEAVLNAMAKKSLCLDRFVQQKIALQDFETIYSEDGFRKGLNTLFVYPKSPDLRQSIQLGQRQKPNSTQEGLALIGTGAFAQKVLVPGLYKAGLRLEAVSSASGLSAAKLAKQHDVPMVSTNNDALISHPDIHTIVIATQHNVHADLCVQAIKVGKHVYVEKPLALDMAQLDAIRDALQASSVQLNVGFNRRFSSLAQKIDQLLQVRPMMNLVITVNAGQLPQNHWLSDSKVSGGRVIGELCHFIDLAGFLTGSSIVSLCANALGGQDEDLTLMLRFANGSAAAINYFTNGHKAYPKERIELYASGKTLVLDNWKKLSGYGFQGFSSMSVSQDKGHQQQFKRLAEQIRQNDTALIPFESLYNTTQASILAVQSLKERRWIEL